MTLPTFTRLVFIFEQETDARIERAVDKARVLFERPARIDLTGLKSRLPDYVSDLDWRLGETGLEISFAVDPASPVRGFKEGTSFVVDITAPDSADAGAAVLGPPRDDSATRTRKPGEAAASDTPDRPTFAGEKADLAKALDTEAESRILEGEGEDRPSPVAPVDLSELPPQPGAPAAAEEGLPDGDYVRPEARRFAATVKLTIPFREPTPAAVFERAGALWAVFRSPQEVDARLLRRDLSGYVSAVETWRSGEATVLRLTLARPLLTTVAGQATSWVITLGDVMLEPGEPLSLLRSAGEGGETQAVVNFPAAAAIHEIRDQAGNERLFVVTALAPTRSVPKAFSFVEFSAPSTVHGLVVAPVADDLAVTREGDDVLIRRERGLTMSEVNADYAPGKSAAFDAVRPGFVNSFDDSSLDPGAVYQLLARHVRETALAQRQDRTSARLQMARALLGTDLGAEALSQLDLIENEDPAALRDPSVRALRGIAMVMMHRPDEAIREFDSFGLGHSPDVALWRGVAEAQRGRWNAALTAFRHGVPAMSSYSIERQRQFRLAAAEAALEVNDIGAAAVWLAELEESQDLSKPDMATALLNARMLAALGQKENAILGFEKVIAAGGPRLAAEAQLRRAETVETVYGEAKTDETIDDLERLALSWRGDEIELGALRLLANLHVRKFDYYRAFEIMKSATIADADSPTTRALQDDMNRAFEELFLGGRADELPAIDALVLYYDFRELTPIGRKGDEIIRALADRMIEVDLLGQAADLLRHQVDNRLMGAERAQVAAKLAWVYMLNRKPADAIVVLSRTRQAVLPREIAYQRLVLEARALAETGRVDLALDLLSSAEGPEVEQIRAEVMWDSERWQEAGEAFERGLGEAWDSTEPLNDGQRMQVLRAAISYALAEDQLGLQRTRTKYLARMAESADAHAFDVVTMPMPERAGEFSELVARVAAVDSLDAFLEEYKTRYVLPRKGSDKLASQS